MLAMFWDSLRAPLANFQKRGENVNCVSYCEVLLKLRDETRRKLPGQLPRGALFHHDNTRSHTARASQERIQELQWELLEHLPYSPGLASGHFHLLGPLKDRRGGTRFADDEEVETEGRKWLRQQSKDFCAEGFDAIVKRWDKCINQNYWVLDFFHRQEL
jgi:hypothetical protein